MASVIGFDIHLRYFPGFGFPPGTARELIGYHGPGPVRLFDRAEIPDVAFLETAHKAIPDFLCIDAKLAVSPEVRALIETLEPGRHQFLDVAIRRERGAVPIKRLDGSVLQTPYYLFNPSVRLDTVWIEKSEVEVATFNGVPPLVFSLPGRKDRVVLRPAIIEGHHVWAGERQLGDKTFFSDTLTQAVLDRKWKGLRFIHLREE